jgi:hypothetical protein
MTGGDLKEIKPPRSSLLSGTSTSLENLKQCDNVLPYLRRPKYPKGIDSRSRRAPVGLDAYCRSPEAAKFAVEKFGSGAVRADPVAPAEQVVNFVGDLGSHGNADVLNDIYSIGSTLIARCPMIAFNAGLTHPPQRVRSNR